MPDTGSLSGTGWIIANGGKGHYSGGAGGGGRIAVTYDDMSGFDPDHATAHGGAPSSATAGGVGTVYLKDRAGEGVLRIDSQRCAALAAGARFAHGSRISGGR